MSKSKNSLSSKTKVLICCHKACELPKDDVFLPIQVGAAISDVDLGMQRDDQVNGEPCDNISGKNKSYCELTAMYWALKNIRKIYPDLEYIGLNHYRRYFSFESKCFFSDFITRPVYEIRNYNLPINKLENYLKKEYVIVAKQKVYQYPLFIDYCMCHIREDLTLTYKVLMELYPDYEESFFRVIMEGCKLSPYNMTIMKWDKFESYCEWLFSILNEIEKRIDITNYSERQKRIFGFLAERLFNVWIDKNCKKQKKLNVYRFDTEKKRNFIRFIVFFRNVIGNKLFYYPKKTLIEWLNT